MQVTEEAYFNDNFEHLNRFNLTIMATYSMYNIKLNKLNFSQVIFKVVLFLKIHLYYVYNLTVVCKNRNFVAKMQ